MGEIDVPLELADGDVVVFQGDSITAGGRDRTDPGSMGSGYVGLIAESLRLPPVCGQPVDGGPILYNRGVSGNRAVDLVDRWEEDCLALRPTVVSIMVGVNDTWRRYDKNDPTSVEDYERRYRIIIEQTLAVGARLILLEPFLVPVRPEMWTWRADLDQRIAVTRALAEEFNTRLLCTDGIMAQAANEAGAPDLICRDGVHPTPLGHARLAQAWLALARAQGAVTV